jgi:leucyl aminopeptidase
MKVAFVDAATVSGATLVARVVDQDALPSDLDPVVAGGAKAARFSGKAAQVFETFAARDDSGVVRKVLVGAGKADAKDRTAALERAGAALVARYLTSGETELVLDLAGSGLDPAASAAVLLGARLRAWRHDTYRTRLTD